MPYRRWGASCSQTAAEQSFKPTQCKSQASQCCFTQTGEDKMVNFIIWLIVGAIIGWLASMLMGQREGLLLNIVVGIVGAFLAGLVLSPLLGIGTINQGNFSLPALIVSLLGAVALLAIVSLFRHGTARR
jgi:uncharacterized membrane protein YeaQ/YmgE (transglycosylase-associated protein family)